MKTARFSENKYQDAVGDNYSLLPFSFSPLSEDKYLLTNLSGEYKVLSRDDVHRLVRHEIPMHSQIYDELKANHFLIDGDSSVAIDLLATKYRTKKAFLENFTSLFMLVVSLRCDHNCIYCQVSHREKEDKGYDMSLETADKCIDFIFRTPSKYIKVEFQGGEPLINYDVVKHIVLKCEERACEEDVNVEYVIATNLSLLTDDILRFCDAHRVFISTSLDGPKKLHNANRPKTGADSYDEVISGIKRVREYLGPNRISALMTTTQDSLSQGRDIVDEYLRQGFSSIFLRMVHPYGRAAKHDGICQYSVDEWLKFYRDTLEYIIELNCQGIVFIEEFAQILLQKILTPYSTGFVDLQSPAGIGIAGIVVNYDGGVYPSDESRMIAEMGDKRFLMGNVLSDSYEDIMLSENLIEPLKQSIAECVPGCSDCAFLPYCGSDPIRHYRMEGDFIGFKPTSVFCQKNMQTIRHLILLLEDDPQAASVFRNWVS